MSASADVLCGTAPIDGGLPRAAANLIVLTPAMRELIANVIEDLLLLLDEIDGDPDLEDDPAHDADREPEVDEPSLGSVESCGPPATNVQIGFAFGDQTRWSGEVVGAQFGPDGEGDTADDEPSLGWTAAIRQDGRNWYGLPPMFGRLRNAVLDGEVGDDNGIGDSGGIDPDAEPDNRDLPTCLESSDGERRRFV